MYIGELIGGEVQLSIGMDRQMDGLECMPPKCEEMRDGGDLGSYSECVVPKTQG